MVDLTGWTFQEVLDSDAREMDLLMAFKMVKRVLMEGGELKLD